MITGHNNLSIKSYSQVIIMVPGSVSCDLLLVARHDVVGEGEVVGVKCGPRQMGVAE